MINNRIIKFFYEYKNRHGKCILRTAANIAVVCISAAVVSAYFYHSGVMG